MIRSFLAAVPALLALSVVAPVHAACVGDCNGNGAVTIEELVTLVDIGLSAGGVERCPAGDVDGDGSIAINELVAAVGNGLQGCPATPTITAAPQTPSATATETSGATESPLATSTATPVTASPTETHTAPASATATASPTEPPPSATSTAPATETESPPPSPSATSTATGSLAPTASHTASGSPTATATQLPPTATVTATVAPPTVTASPTGVPPSATASTTATVPPPTGSATATATVPVATATPTASTTPPATASVSGTATQSGTPTRTPTFTVTASRTPTPSVTLTPTRTDTVTRTATPTRTDTPTRTPTFSATSTRTLTPTPTASGTRTSTPTVPPTATATPGLGVRHFTLDPASSRLDLEPGLGSFTGFTGFLDLAVGVPNPSTGLAPVAVTGASTYLSVAVGSLTFCIKPLVPVQNAGVLSCNGGIDLGVSSTQDHHLGAIDVDGFTEEDCAAANGSIESAQQPHPGVCNGPVEIGASPQVDSGVGALLIGADVRFGSQGLPVEISFDVGACPTHASGQSTVLGLVSALSRATILDAGDVDGEVLEQDVSGENFSCGAWMQENGPGRLVFASPALHGAGAQDLVTVIVLDD